MNDGHFSCDFESGSSGDCDRSIPLLFNLRGTRVIKSRSLSILSQLTLSRFHPYFSFVAVFTNEDLISTHSCRLFFIVCSSPHLTRCSALFSAVCSQSRRKNVLFFLFLVSNFPAIRDTSLTSPPLLPSFILFPSSLISLIYICIYIYKGSFFPFTL